MVRVGQERIERIVLQVGEGRLRRTTLGTGARPGRRVTGSGRHRVELVQGLEEVDRGLVGLLGVWLELLRARRNVGLESAGVRSAGVCERRGGRRVVQLALDETARQLKGEDAPQRI